MANHSHPWLKLLIGIVIAWTIAFAMSGSAFAAGKMEDVLVLQQEHMYLGKLTIYLGQTGMRIDCPLIPMLVVSKAPTWKVVIYCKTSHLALERSFAEWSDKGMSMIGSLRTMKFAKEDNGYDTKLKVKTVLLTSVENATYATDPLATFYRSKIEPVSLKSKVLTYTNQIKISPRASSFLGGLFKMPKEVVLPISYIWFDKSGKIWRPLRTEAIYHRQMSSDWFSYPTGYKIAETDEQLVVMGNRKQELEDIFGGLIGHEDEPAKKSQKSR